MNQDNHLQAGMSAQMQTDRPITALEEHMNQLESLYSGLERASLQYDNILSRLRGAHPTDDGATNKMSEPVSIIDRLRTADDRLSNVCAQLNNTADELNGIM